jgi:hypothetical protein
LGRRRFPREDRLQFVLPIACGPLSLRQDRGDSREA